MAGITSQNPLLQTSFIQGILDAYIPDPAEFVMQQYYPVTPIEDKVVKWDERSPLNFGLTKATVPGAESPIIKGGYMKQYTAKPVHFREKVVLRREDLVGIRQVGTRNDLLSGADVVKERTLWLRGRVQSRIEWMGWQAAQGRIAIQENEVNEVYNYSLPTHLNVTKSGTAKWDAPTTANPLNDIMNFVALSQGYGWQFGSIWMSPNTARVALQIDQFRTFFRDAMQGGVLQGANIATMELLTKIMQVHMPAVPDIKVWGKGYYVETPITTYAAAGAASVVVDESLYFEQNDQVTLVNSVTRDTQLMTLNGGPVGNTLNFLTTLSAPYPAGSVVRMYKPYIPDGLLIFMPRFGAGVPSLGRTYMTPTEWTPGSLMNPKAGIFFEVQNHENEDPKRDEFISGFEGISVTQYTGMHGMLHVY